GPGGVRAAPCFTRETPQIPRESRPTGAGRNFAQSAARTTPSRLLAMRRTKQVADYAAYVVVRSVICIVQAIPLETCHAWARRLAWLMWHVVKLRRSL